MITSIPLEIIDMKGDGFHLAIKVFVNEIEARFILDTGASRTVLDENRIHKFADNIESTPNEVKSAGLGTNDMQSIIFSIDSLMIGDLYISNYKTVAIDMTHINLSYETLNMPLIDGVLGGDILSEFKAVIDYSKSILKLKYFKKDYPLKTL
jgi:predicted aspartyl protease